MKTRYHIYKTSMNGDKLLLLSSNKFSLNKIPVQGFKKKKKAKKFLKKLINKRKGDGFERNWYRYVILKTYHSYQAFYLEDKNKNLQKIAGFPKYLATILNIFNVHTLSDVERLSYKNISQFFEEKVLDDLLSQLRKYSISIKK